MSDGYTAQGQIAQVEFDKKVIVYWWLQALGLMLSTVILIPLIPVWLLVGYFFHQKQFDHLSCVLTDRSINIRSGLLFKNSRTSLWTKSPTSQLWVGHFCTRSASAKSR